MKTALPLLGLAFAATLLALPAPAFAGVEVKTSEKGITYSIRMPQDYDRAKGAILVIGFHGRGGNNKNFMDALNQYDCLKSAIVVTPNAPGNAMWETNDVPVISDLIQELQRVHHPPRTIACGF